MEWFKFLKGVNRAFGRPGSIVAAGVVECEEGDTAPDAAPTPIGMRALNLARLELGNGEELRNNAGPHCARYRAGDGTGAGESEGAWCASFCAYLFTEANGGKAPFPTSRSAKALVKAMGKAGRVLERPEPGALIAWHRGLRDAHGRWTWQGHVELVEDLLLEDVLLTIGGNRGPYPSKVSRFRYQPAEWRNRLFMIATLD